MKKIDLHVHTTNSDGFLTPYEVIDEAVRNEVEILSIADHDITSAYTKDLMSYAKNKGIMLIPAVEISSKIGKVGVHILGYNIDLKNIEFQQKLKEIRNSRHDYLINVGKKLNEEGYILNINELDKIESVTKAHIATDIINNKKNKKQLLKDFKCIPEKGEFIETIMNEGCKAFVKKNSITPQEAANLIRKANGKVVLAHPVAYKYEDNLNENQVIDLINLVNPSGIEANYIYIDKHNNKINDIEKWKKVAKNKKLFITVGSDFHNFDEIHPLIGLVNETIDYENIFDFLKECGAI